jgi:hypothetical protein
VTAISSPASSASESVSSTSGDDPLSDAHGELEAAVDGHLPVEGPPPTAPATATQTVIQVLEDQCGVVVVTE